MATIENLTENVQERLADYLSAMRPGAILTDGAAKQTMLWNVIRLILRQEASDFVTLMNLLLNTIKENRQGCFNERYVYRDLEGMKVTMPERRNFERLMNLFLTTCDPQTRQVALRQVSLETSLAGLTSDAERQRLQAFYTAN